VHSPPPLPRLLTLVFCPSLCPNPLAVGYECFFCGDGLSPYIFQHPFSLRGFLVFLLLLCNSLREIWGPAPWFFFYLFPQILPRAVSPLFFFPEGLFPVSPFPNLTAIPPQCPARFPLLRVAHDNVYILVPATQRLFLFFSFLWGVVLSLRKTPFPFVRCVTIVQS